MKNKNIHIIPTDKPSRLCIDNSCNELNYSEIEGLNSKHITNQNIYITSDEEIKEKTLIFCSKENRVIVNQYHTNIPITYKKIILTTDPQLIADGVQAIDNEFLEWFVKNPSCEKVEVETTRERNGYHSKHKKRYKIIIPQEEPKQEELKFKNRQIGAAGFVANQIMENMINKPKLDTVGKEFYESADMTITVKIPQTKYNADLVVPRAEPKVKYTLRRLNDGLTKTGSRVQYVEYDEITNEGKSSHDDIKVGRSLMLEPRMQFTWLTTRITEITEQRDGYIKFQTQNSTYELIES